MKKHRIARDLVLACASLSAAGWGAGITQMAHRADLSGGFDS